MQVDTCLSTACRPPDCARPEHSKDPKTALGPAMGQPVTAGETPPATATWTSRGWLTRVESHGRPAITTPRASRSHSQGMMPVCRRLLSRLEHVGSLLYGGPGTRVVPGEISYRPGNSSCTTARKEAWWPR